MKIKTKDGLAEPMPLSDLQRNNRILAMLGIILCLFLLYIIFMTFYIIENDVVNNIVARCI